MEYKDPGRYIPIIYLLYSCGSRFGVPSRVPLSGVWAATSLAVQPSGVVNPRSSKCAWRSPVSGTWLDLLRLSLLGNPPFGSTHRLYFQKTGGKLVWRVDIAGV